MSKPENPPAFPRTGEGFGNPHYDTSGMSLLDYFAGQALAGYMAKFPQGDRITIVSECWEIAEDMIAARTALQSHRGDENG